LDDAGALQSWGLQLLRKSVGRHSEILQYRSRERACIVVVKRIINSIRREDAEETILREFRSLQTIRKCLPEELLATVPKPIMVLRESRALVSEALSGRPLRGILKLEANRLIGPFRRNRMRALGQLTGRWLKDWHDATHIDPLHHDSATFLEELDERLLRCRTLGIAQETIDRLKYLITEASHRLEGHPIPAAGRQGDFIPQNLLIDGDQLRVVDFENFSRSDSIYEDLSTFMAYVRAVRTFPYYSARALGTLGESFLHAYGVQGDEAPLRLYLARSLIVLISEMDIPRTALYGQRRLQLLQTQVQRVCTELPHAHQF
jgi:aminoglycoside phosphotransferase (APT) family kinase protein